ncbi:hypothetical protein [Pedobacter yulinensis]|nr:hypothetical protein [Pedobacter yulinensis]
MKKSILALCVLGTLAFGACNSDKSGTGGDTATTDTMGADHTMTDTGTMDTVKRDSMDNRRVDTAAKMQP